ncbi:MAG: SH3 domain-containing protein [Rhizobacter sp.]|nr:SH3 domain-containing protein [Burkholderiales bacterium]
MTTIHQAPLASLAKLVAVGMTATVLVASAAAQQAYTTRSVNLRAGPDQGYPQVAYIGPNRPVYVNGCIDDYRWCDITAGSNRGWAYSRYIEYPYQNRRVQIYGNGQTLALPIVSFILGSYWNENYRNRPFYNNQNNWDNWRPGNRPPPGYGNGYRPQPPRPPISIQPPRPPIVRPQPPKPPVYERPDPGRPQILPPRPQGSGEGLPGFVTPGPNSPAGQR